MRRAGGTLVAALLLGTAAPVLADTGYEDEDLSLRLASAFIRFTEVTAFGGETAANRWSPAVNPASADWSPVPSRLGVLVAGYWSHIEFEEGNAIDLFGETAIWDTREAGTLHLTLSQVRSNEEEDRFGLEFDYSTDTVQLQWGKRTGPVGVGFMVNYAESEVVQRSMGLPVARSDAETWRFRLGLLWEPQPKWLLGFVGEYGESPFEFEALAPTPLGLLPVQGDDVQTQGIVRGGLSYEYAPLSVVYADYQFGRFQNERGELDVHRLNAGVQHRALEFLFARAGATTDLEGNPGFTAGVGAAFAEWGTIDLGYQYAVLPELEPNFGTSHTFQVTLSVRF